jgi:lysyl-tRNA synthetase class 2
VLETNGYVEVDTPLLLAPDRVAEGRSFRTLADSFGAPLYLRASPLHLKLLLASGFDRVCEVLKCFRDEPTDSTHNMEYSLIEAYAAYGDYRTMQDLAQSVIRAAAWAVNQSSLVSDSEGCELDLDEPWPVVTVHDAVSKLVGHGVTAHSSSAELVTLARRAGMLVPETWAADRIVLELYEKLVEPNTIGPKFFTDFPSSLSPMARAHRSTPGLAEKWDLVIFGREVATAYTELVDPREQRRRLEKLWASNDTDEAAAADEEFLRVLEMGMPPCGGLTIGLERLLMTLTGSADIREVIPFPLMPRREPG